MDRARESSSESVTLCLTCALVHSKNVILKKLRILVLLPPKINSVDSNFITKIKNLIVIQQFRTTFCQVVENAFCQYFFIQKVLCRVHYFICHFALPCL